MIANLPDWAKFIFVGLCVIGIWGYVELLEALGKLYQRISIANYDRLIAKRKADLEEKKILRKKRKADLATRRNRK